MSPITASNENDDPDDWSPEATQNHRDPLLVELGKRHKTVTDLTQRCYEGDVVTPTLKSQILRAQKFSVLYYYAFNFILFVYAFFIPLNLDPPYYGGLDIRDFQPSRGQLAVMGICLLLPIVRFVVLSWADEFYQYGLVLVTFEAVWLIFTFWCWSPGMPILLVLFYSNLLNTAVSQFYWFGAFQRTVADLKELVPPSSYHTHDSTILDVWPGLSSVVWEMRKLWGFTNQSRTEAAMYDERCGVFGGKATMSHGQAMQMAYNQGLFPATEVVQWRHVSSDLWQLSWLGLLDGLVNTFISNAAYCFVGLWLGRVLLENDWYHAEWAITMGIVMCVVAILSFIRTKTLVEEGLGVTVAEKEWLAYDVVQHQGEREEMLFDVLDINSARAQLSGLGHGRLNLVFMWLCIASVADFVGESYLARVYWNLSLEARYMIEALTPYDFKLYPHAKWEVSIRGILIKVFHTMVLTMISCLYFGTYFKETWLPVPLMALIGVACFIQSIVKIVEVMQFSFTILGSRKTTNRHAFVSESIVVVVFCAVLINILIWLYLVPIMKNWDLPVGGCGADLNRKLFPSACYGKR